MQRALRTTPLRVWLFGSQKAPRTSRSVSTAAEVFTLSSDQPADSPIDVSRVAPTILHGTSPMQFRIYPRFLSIVEQATLLECALKKLDDTRGVSRAAKKRRKNHLSSVLPSDNVFLPIECYDFDEAHFDSVIHDYRECSVSVWPEAVHSILGKALALMPNHPTLATVQTHALHLSSTGEILPHVDNVEASGGTILGISLGSSRVMRLASKNNTDCAIDVLLEPGSVYIQSDDVRYKFVHSIARESSFRGQMVKEGQRLSIMIRDLYKAQA